MKYLKALLKKTPLELAKEHLLEHERELVLARQAQHSADTNALYREGCIEDLKKIIANYEIEGQH